MDSISHFLPNILQNTAYCSRSTFLWLIQSQYEHTDRMDQAGLIRDHDQFTGSWISTCFNRELANLFSLILFTLILWWNLIEFQLHIYVVTEFICRSIKTYAFWRELYFTTMPIGVAASLLSALRHSYGKFQFQSEMQNVAPIELPPVVLALGYYIRIAGQQTHRWAFRGWERFNAGLLHWWIVHLRVFERHLILIHLTSDIRMWVFNATAHIIPSNILWKTKSTFQNSLDKVALRTEWLYIFTYVGLTIALITLWLATWNLTKPRKQ